MADEFDINAAEKVLMEAQLAMAPSRGHDRIAQFPNVVQWFGKSIDEVKRVRIVRTALVAEALRELNDLILAQLDDAMRRRGDLVEEVKNFRGSNFRLQRDDNGDYRWVVKPESDIHVAIEKLTSAMLEADRSL